MMKYFYNPITEDIVIFNQKESEIFVLEKIKKVRVVVADDVQMGDYGNRRELLKGNGLKQGHREASDYETGISGGNPGTKKRKQTRKKNPLTAHWTVQSRIKEAKEKGMTSEECAVSLGIPLEQVNNYWV